MSTKVKGSSPWRGVIPSALLLLASKLSSDTDTGSCSHRATENTELPKPQKSSIHPAAIATRQRVDSDRFPGAAMGLLKLGLRFPTSHAAQHRSVRARAVARINGRIGIA